MLCFVIIRMENN